MQENNMRTVSKKILVVTGTRAEYGLLRSVMDAVRAHPHLSLRLLVTGAHTLKAYGYTKKEIERDGYPIDCTVPISPASDMLQAFVQEIEGIRVYCLRERPNLILVNGDRDEAFAAATVAAHLDIPLAHTHGGDVTGPGVDDALRNSITKMAHIHFPGTKKSARRLRSLGEESWRIIEAGSITLDVFQHIVFMKRKELASQLELDPARPWLTVLQHPTTFDTVPLAKQISSTISALGQFPEHEKILLYPNNDTGSELFVRTLRALKGPRYHVFPSLPRVQYLSMLRESDALGGNSSSGIMEIALVGTPTVNIGNRQAGRERGRGVIDVPYDARRITRSIRRAIVMKRRQKGRPFRSPYGKGGAGKAIAKHIHRLLDRPDLLRKKPPLSGKK